MTFLGVEVVSVKKLKLTHLLREIMSDITYVHAFRKIHAAAIQVAESHQNLTSIGRMNFSVLI